MGRCYRAAIIRGVTLSLRPPWERKPWGGKGGGGRLLGGNGNRPGNGQPCCGLTEINEQVGLGSVLKLKFDGWM